MIELVFICTSILLIAISILPLLPSDHWVCRIWEFPRVQIVFLITVNLFFVIAFTQTITMYILMILNILNIVYQCFWILPYTLIYPKEVQWFDSSVKFKASNIKVLTSNVLMTNKSASKLINLVDRYKPDILVTLESNEWWQEALSPIRSDYPYRVNRPLGNLYGMHVFSKFKISDLEIVDLIEKDIPSVHCSLEIETGLFVACHFVHPAPPSPTENKTAKPRDKELLLVAKKVKPLQNPTIVTGDLNDVAWSPTTRDFRKISGLLDPRIGRGFFNTFHAGYPVVRWPLDHLFHSQHFKLVDLKRLPSIDSDHFPLLTELMFIEEPKDRTIV